MTLKDEICGRCGKQVYHAEKKVAINKVWHQFCFNCVVCQKLLNPGNFSTHRGELFCQQCYYEATSYEIDFGKTKHSSGHRESKNDSSNRRSRQSKKVQSAPERSEILESSNLLPSQIKSTLQKRKHLSEAHPSEESIRKSIERKSKASEDSLSPKIPNRQRRNAICCPNGPLIENKTRNKSLPNEENQEIFCETTHTSFPIRSTKKKTSRDVLEHLKTRRNLISEDQEDSAYETENPKSQKETGYQKISSFLSKAKNCNCPKNATYSEFVYEDTSKKPAKRNIEDMSTILISDSPNKSTHNRFSTKNQNEEVLFISQSGTTKIVKITSPKKQQNKTLKKSKSQNTLNKTDLKNTSHKKKNEKVYNDNKLRKSRAEESLPLTAQDSLNKMKKIRKEHGGVCNISSCEISKKLKKTNSEESSHKPGVKNKNSPQKLKTAKDKSDDSLYQTSMKMKKKSSSEEFKKLKKRKSQDALKDKESPEKMKKSKTVDKDDSEESYKFAKKSKQLKAVKSEDSLSKPTVKDNSPSKMKKDKKQCNKKKCLKTMKSSPKLKTSKSNSGEYILLPPQKKKLSSPLKENCLCAKFWRKTKDDTLKQSSDSPKRSERPSLKKQKAVEEETPVKDRRNSKKHEDKSRMKSPPSNESIKSKERKSSKSKHSISLEDSKFDLNKTSQDKTSTSKSKSEKKEANQKKKDKSEFHQTAKLSNTSVNRSSFIKDRKKHEDKALLDKSKKDKQNKNEETTKKLSKDTVDQHKSSNINSTIQKKKKPKHKGDDFASITDFFKPTYYSSPKGDHKVQKKKSVDKTEENLVKTAEKLKELTKKHKETPEKHHKEEKPDKHKKIEDTPEKKESRNKSRKKNSKEDVSKTVSPIRGFFNFSSKKKDANKSKQKHNSKDDTTEFFKTAISSTPPRRSSKEKKTQHSKLDDLEDFKLDKTSKDVSEEELYTTAYDVYYSSNDKQKLKNEEIPYHTSLKYPVGRKEDLFSTIKIPRSGWTSEANKENRLFFMSKGRSASFKFISNKNSVQKIKKPQTCNNPVRGFNFDKDDSKFYVTTEKNPKTKKNPGRQSSGTCKVPKHIIVNKINDPQTVANWRMIEKHNKNNTSTPKNALYYEDMLESTLATGDQLDESRETLIRKLRKKLCYIYGSRQISAVTKSSSQTVLNSPELYYNKMPIDGISTAEYVNVGDMNRERYSTRQKNDSNNTFCRRCNEKVFIVESKFAANGIFHTQCFSCYICHRHLDSLNLIPRQEEIYCKQCYMKYYGPHTYGYGMAPNLHVY